MTLFESKSDAYKRLQSQELETARYVRDMINKNDDTRELWRMLTSVLNVAEARVLSDMGEGRKPDGTGFTESDFWTCVGEVRGLRTLPSRIKALVEKADRADENETLGNTD